MTAIRSWRNLIYKEIATNASYARIREREVQRPLHLPAELLCLPLRLAAVRPIAVSFSIENLSEVRVYELRSFTLTFSSFHKTPFCAHARRAGRRKNANAASTNKLKDGANPADRLD